ncbi:MAG TPA: hypothetical protein VLV16_08310 [Gemmatimonadales bacterium]|nr:hypothetical protein [Gemmatimonadales bacterium]
MTQTAVRLRRLGLPHARARAGAILLSCAGVALAVAAAGLWLAPHLAAIVAAWVALGAVAGVAIRASARAGRGTEPGAVARLVEAAAGARAGSVAGVLPAGTPHASEALLALADVRAARVVDDVAAQVRLVLARSTRRRVVLGVVAVALGTALFVIASPATGRAAFWHPLRALADARAPVRLELDRTTVQRGDSVTVTVTVAGAMRATLWTRGPGEPWHPAPLAIDSAGRSVRRLGPLDGDLYLRATSGTRRSADSKVTVALPAFVAELELTARFPSYLNRPDEPLVPGADTVVLPAGTSVQTNGAASVRLARAGWTGPDASPLAVLESRFTGHLTPRRSGSWRLALVAADGSEIAGDMPELHVRVQPDSAPVVSIPVPGRDAALSIGMRQPLVIDARDDHGITRVEIVSWRMSQTGKVGEPVRQMVPVPGASDRALLQAELDATRRGLLPGDTLRLRVDAWDNAPVPHQGRSAELALRLPTLAELRAATRAAASEVAGAGDSLAAAAGDLSQRTADLARQRTREGDTAGRTPDAAAQAALPFPNTERAAAIAEEQTRLAQRARELAERVEEVSRAAQAAGLYDTAFQRQLADVEHLLRQAMTPELEQRLRELDAALGRLDPDATRRALEHLAEAQQNFREALERSRELFRRAALEGLLASLAADAQDLRFRQSEWNQRDAPSPDSAAAGRQRALQARADSLAKRIAEVSRHVAGTDSASNAQAEHLEQPQEAAVSAGQAMGRAARAAEARDARGAGRGGHSADSALAEVLRTLQKNRDSLAHAWKQETAEALKAALSETAALAEQEGQVADALQRGETGAPIRGQQASAEDGAEAVARRIRSASGKNALVSPQLDAMLGFAQRQMRGVRDQLTDANPNGNAAAGLAEQGVDALNATALALARILGDVEGAESGSGFGEAVSRLGELARQQQGLNGQTQGLLPFLGAGGQAVLDRMRQLAAEQRAMAEQLERLRAQGANPGTAQLADEARDLARQLESGHVDARLVERQDRLYHRLLDAGRTLTGPEPDEDQRRSRAATGDSVHLPGALAPGATGAGPRIPYPTWQALSGLTAEERRLVLEYFRRLNAPNPTPDR